MKHIRIAAVLLLLGLVLTGCRAEEAAQQTQHTHETETQTELRKKPKTKRHEILSEAQPEETPQAVTEQTEPPETVSPQQLAMDALAQTLEAELQDRSDKWAVYVEDLATGASCVGEKNTTCTESIVGASIGKLFVMGAVYEQVSKGTVSESEIAEPMRKMITVSDNQSTNQLILRLGGGDAQKGMDAVNAYAASIGCEHSILNRLMADFNGKQNYVSAKDCAVILRMIYEGRCVNAECSEKMMELLQSQYYNDYIPKGPPAGTTVAHKGGDLDGISHGDVGIVYAENGPYIICIICNDPTSDAGSEEEIVRISKLVAEAMMKG